MPFYVECMMNLFPIRTYLVGNIKIFLFFQGTFTFCKDLSNKLWAEYAEFKDELIVEEDPRKHVRRFAFFEKE